MSSSKQVAAAVIIIDEWGVLGRKRKNKNRREMWAKKWLLGRDRFTHLNLLNFIRSDSPVDYKNYLRMSDENVQYLTAKVKPRIAKHGSSLVTKLALSVFVAVWIDESGLGPPTHVRANSKQAASRAPPKALTSQARVVQVRLVTLHTQTSLTHWKPTPAGLASQIRTCMDTLTVDKKKRLTFNISRF
jgi:hypothetical protein